VKPADLKAAAISLGVHGALVLLVWSLAPAPVASPAPAPARRTSAATRVGLLGRASAVRAESPAPPTPAAAVRNRGPVRRQPQSVEMEMPAGEVEAPAEEASAPAQGGAAADGDGLAGALAHSADALSGDPRAAGVAEALVREAVKAPTPDLSLLNARLQAAAARCYPEGARRFRQSGVTTLEFCLDARGGLLRSGVRGSSGSGLLDEAAAGCVLPGALPAGPEVGAGCFTLPVRFGGAR
jgi:TonB family protein